MSKLYVHHNLTAIESDVAFGGGGGGGSSSGRRKYGRPTSIEEAGGGYSGGNKAAACGALTSATAGVSLVPHPAAKAASVVMAGATASYCTN